MNPKVRHLAMSIEAVHAANNVESAYTPTNSSWLNRVEAQFTALRYLALDGTDHASHQEQASMIRRYIIWRKQPRLRRTPPPGRRPGERSLTRH
jgi:transposase